MAIKVKLISMHDISQYYVISEINKCLDKFDFRNHRLMMSAPCCLDLNPIEAYVVLSEVVFIKAARNVYSEMNLGKKYELFETPLTLMQVSS